MRNENKIQNEFASFKIISDKEMKLKDILLTRANEYTELLK